MASEYPAYLSRRSRARLLLRRLFLLPVRRFFHGQVLDIGSGIGEFLEIYRDAVGLDREMDNVSRCVSRGHRCLCADACRLPFLDRSFDGILLNNVLEHLEYPDAAMKEVARVLKKGGKLIIVGYVPGQPFPLDTMAMHYNEWDIKGSRLCTTAELLQVIRLVEEGKIRPVISKTFPMEKVNEALRELPAEGTTGRLVLTL